jgi:uncharacterized membrane protein
MLAAVRPDSGWEIALFLHVAGATLLVGGLVVTAAALVFAWRTSDDEGSAKATRLGYLTLFFVVLPSFVGMRVGAQWVLEESPFDDEAGWVGLGFILSDLGGLGLIASLVIAGIGLRRGVQGRAVPARVVTVITVLLLIAYVVAIWAMTTKPD